MGNLINNEANSKSRKNFINSKNKTNNAIKSILKDNNDHNGQDTHDNHDANNNLLLKEELKVMSSKNNTTHKTISPLNIDNNLTSTSKKPTTRNTRYTNRTNNIENYSSNKNLGVKKKKANYNSNYEGSEESTQKIRITNTTTQKLNESSKTSENLVEKVINSQTNPEILKFILVNVSNGTNGNEQIFGMFSSSIVNSLIIFIYYLLFITYYYNTILHFNIRRYILSLISL